MDTNRADQGSQTNDEMSRNFREARVTLLSSLRAHLSRSGEPVHLFVADVTLDAWIFQACYVMRYDDIFRLLALGAELGAIELFLDLVESVVADFLGIPQAQDGVAGGADGATPQWIGW
ncbi:hypothetical protein BRAS3843_2780002 [Bradyrhizobium sp. STM 3843]|nr:hypothetical protein BRAS3843_2780002 [Bradyrhizobium sp. STM 3843]